MIGKPRMGVSALFVTLIAFSQFQNAATQSQDAKTLPSDSTYNLKVSIEDQNGKTSGLDRYRGEPVLVTMFYASCPHVCPLLISTIKVTEARLTEAGREKLRVLTISIDPEVDTPDVLLETLQRHAVDGDRWTMARSEAGDLRAIAGVFGIKYKKLPDGEFNHTTRIVLLDRDGTIVASTDQLGRHDPAFLDALRTILQ